MHQNDDGGGQRRLRVSIYAMDQLTGAGVAAMLRSCSALAVVPRETETEADAAVVATEGVTADFLGTLRTMAERTAKPMVFIVPDQWNANLLSAMESGMARVVHHTEVTRERLCQEILTVTEDAAQPRRSIRAQVLGGIEAMLREIHGLDGLGFHGLRSRELTVLRLVAEGCSLQEVGRKLSYSESAVKNILRAVTTRMGMRNKTQAVAYAARIGAI